VPAAAVIPAPIAYIKVVAVKKLVVEFRGPFFNVVAWRPRGVGATPCSGGSLAVDGAQIWFLEDNLCPLLGCGTFLYSRHLL
jgi:hypothetical protein